MEYDRSEFETISFHFPNATGKLTAFISKDSKEAVATESLPYFVNHDQWSVVLTEKELDAKRILLTFFDTAGKTMSKEGSARVPVVVVNPGTSVDVEKIMESIHAEIQAIKGLIPSPVKCKSPTKEEFTGALQGFRVNKEVEAVWKELCELEETVKTRSSHGDPAEKIEEIREVVGKQLCVAMADLTGAFTRFVDERLNAFVLALGDIQKTQEEILAKLATLSTFDPEKQTVEASNMRGTEGVPTSVPDYTPLMDLLESRSTLNKEDLEACVKELATKAGLTDTTTAICSLLHQLLEKGK